MGALIVFLMILGCLILWAFFAFPPRYANQKQVRVFNWTTVGMCSMICLAWLLNVHSVFSEPAFIKYLHAFAIGGALTIEIVFLGIFFLLRNFWIFKPPRRPGGMF